MPRLRFQQASQQLEVPNIAAPAQLRGGQVPNVMQFLQYDIGPAQAVSNLGKVAGKAADRLYDHYIYDLERGDRERRRDEGDVTNSLATSIKGFVSNLGRERTGEFRDRGIAAEDFEISVQKEIDDQIEVLLGNDLVAAHIESHNLSESQAKKFRNRLKNSLENASLAGEDRIIGRKFDIEDQQVENDYNQAIIGAKQDFAQAVQDKGLLFKSQYTAESSRQQLSQDINDELSSVIEAAKNNLPERFHTRLEQELRGQFINQNGQLQLWAVNKEFSEDQKNKVKDVNLARRQASIEFRDYMREQDLENKLKETNDPEVINQLSQQIVSKAQEVVSKAATARGIKNERDIALIGQDLQAIAGEGDYNMKVQAINRFLREEDELERENERLQALTEDQRRAEAQRAYNEQVAPIIQNYNNRNITFKEAQDQLKAASESVQSQFLRVAPIGQELSPEDKVFNGSITQSVDGIYSSINLSISREEGNRENSLSQTQKLDRKRLEETQKAAIIDDAAIEYRRRLINFNEDMVRKPSSAHTSEFIQQEQNRLLNETLDEFAPQDFESQFPVRSEVNRALSKIQISQAEQIVRSVTANQIRLKSGGEMGKYLSGLREKRKELEGKVKDPNIMLSPIDAGEQFQAFAQTSRASIVETLKQTPGMGAVAEDFEFAAEHKITVPSMITGFVSEMDRENVKITKTQHVARADEIAGNTGEINLFQDMYRTFDNDQDPRINAIQDIYRPSVGSIYTQGEYDQIIQGYSTKIDNADANNLLLKGDKESLELGYKLLQEPGAAGAGFPGLVGQSRRGLRNNFKTALEQLQANDRIGLQIRLENHNLYASTGSENFNPNLLESLRDESMFNADPAINQRMYQTAKAQQRFSLSFYSLTNGTEENLPEQFEPGIPLNRKSDAAISAVMSELEPQNFMGKYLQDIPKDSVRLSDLTSQYGKFQTSVGKVLEDRENNPSRVHSLQYRASLSPESLVPKNDEEIFIRDTFPALWQNQVFSSDRINFVNEEQRRIQKNRVPLSFDDGDIDLVNAAWDRTAEDGQARAALIQMIESQAGDKAAEVFTELDTRSKIKIQHSLYADYAFSGTVLTNLHAALTATDKQLYSRIGEEPQDRYTFNQDFRNDPDVTAFSSAFAVDSKTRTQMEVAVRKYALNLMSVNTDLDQTDAITQAKQDLIFNKYVLVPSDFGKTHFLAHRSETNALIKDQPEFIQRGLKTYTDNLELNEASKRVYEDEQTFFVRDKNGSLVLFGMFAGKPSPVQDSNNKMIVVGKKQMNRLGLEAYSNFYQERINFNPNVYKQETLDEINAEMKRY